MVPTGSVGAARRSSCSRRRQAVGINLVIDTTDFVTSLSKADAGTYDTFQIGWSGRVDPDGNIYQFVATTGSQNDSGYSNPRLDLILNNARKAATLKARTTLYRAAQKIILADRPLIYLYHPVTRAGIADEPEGRLALPGHAPPGRVRGVQVARRVIATMGGFLLRKAGAALVVARAGEHARLPRRPRDPRRSGDRARRENRDPALLAAIRHKYMLDRPLPVQYAHWIWLALHGDLGVDQAAARRAHDRHAHPDHARAGRSEHARRNRSSGIPAGVIAAVRRGKPSDYVATAVALVGLSVPHFWLGLLLIIWFAVDLHWLPACGFVPLPSDPVGNLSTW